MDTAHTYKLLEHLRADGVSRSRFRVLVDDRSRGLFLLPWPVVYMMLAAKEHEQACATIAMSYALRQTLTPGERQVVTEYTAFVVEALRAAAKEAGGTTQDFYAAACAEHTLRELYRRKEDGTGE
jgi:hypothetical protein